MKDLNLKKRFKWSTILFQVGYICSIYRTTISFYENHEPVQGWNPATTIKINDKKRYLMIFKNTIKTISNNYLPWWKLKMYADFQWGRRLILSNINCLRTVCEQPTEYAETESLKMIGQWSNLCLCHSPRTSFNAKMGRVP